MGLSLAFSTRCHVVAGRCSHDMLRRAMTTHSADNTTLFFTINRLKASFSLAAAATPCPWSLSLYL